MQRNLPVRFFAIVAAVWSLGQAASLLAIETTYGEDPIPNSHCYKGFIDLGYGIDPIPAKSLSQRWQEWRGARNQQQAAPRRVESAPSGRYPYRAAPEATQRPSSRRADQTQPSQRRR